MSFSAEKKFHATEDQALAKTGRPEAAKAVWEKFLADYEDTCLRPRIEQMIKGIGLR